MPIKILLVEDEPNIAEALRFILQKDGFSVGVISDGARAMDRIRADAPSLVILDVMIPTKSGFEVLKEIRAAEDTAALPVLMLTAKAQDRARANTLGANHFITKPFSNQKVLEAVRNFAIP